MKEIPDEYFTGLKDFLEFKDRIDLQKNIKESVNVSQYRAVSFKAYEGYFSGLRDWRQVWC